MGTLKQTGSSLVEVMVALFVLAIGLLGVLAMQAKSMQYNQSAHVYSQAVFLANDMAERLRLDPAAARAHSLAIPTGAQTCTACSGGDLINYNLFLWQERVAAALPEGKVKIEEV